MSLGIKVLINISDLVPFDGGDKPLKESILAWLEESGREKVEKCIADGAASELENYYTGGLKDCPELELLGAEKPTALKHMAETWNASIIDELARAFTVFEEAARKGGCASIGEFIRAADSASQKGHVKLPCSLDYGMAAYNLRHALFCAENILWHGSERAVIDRGNYFANVSARIDSGTLKNASEHPEEYAIVWLYAY